MVLSTLYVESSYDPADPPLGVDTQPTENICSHDIVNVHNSLIHASPKVERTQKFITE